MAEKDILDESEKIWLPKLYDCFIDKNFLYLVMEFLPGGDMMSLFTRKDLLNEEET